MREYYVGVRLHDRHMATFFISTLCPRKRDSPVNGDPTSVLVKGTPRYPDKMLFCPNNKCLVNEDLSPVNEDFPPVLVIWTGTVLSG